MALLPSTVVGVLLAAGAGRWYGKPKVLVDGWLDTAVGALRDGGCNDVILVLGAVEVSAPAGVTAITAPAGAIPLPPDSNGYVFIETKSGMTRCQINRDSVGCEAPFTNSPLRDGEHANGIHITAGGSVQWVLGNLGAIPTVSIDYRTYEAQGWTIDATTDGTRFTNNRTGHGMFVSIEKVDTF